MSDFFSHLDLNIWIVQGIGALGFAIYILSFQWLEPRKTILQQAAANFTLLFHFLFLSPSLMVPYMSLTSTVRDLSSGLLPQRYHRFALIGYVVILLIGAVFLARQIFDFLGLIGCLLVASSHLFRDRFYIYRALNMANLMLWFIVSLYLMSWPGIVVYLCIMTSNIIGVVRYRIRDET